MKEKEKNILWRKLDNSAKLFPSISNKRFSTVFRISSVLNEVISPILLELAVNEALEKFSSFKVRLRKGLFWFYLDENQKKTIIEMENNYPCKYINLSANNNYLFKVTYFENKINLDVFHALTDGNSAMHFFKEIIYNYIENSHKEEFKINNRNKSVVINNTEDSYLKNYDKHLGKREKSKKAYAIEGKKLPLFAIGVIHFYIELSKLKEICKIKEITITRILSSCFNKSNI